MGSLFRQLVDTLPSQTGALGATLRFSIPRDFPHEAIVIKLNVIVATTAATLAAERASGLLNRVRLYANDGGTQRSIIDCDGLAIHERAAQYGQSLDAQTAVAIGGTLAAATYNISFPFYFAPAIIGTPTADIFLQNLPRFNNDPTLEIVLATQAQIDPNATPTFALTGSITVTIIRFLRQVTVKNWKFLNTEFLQQEQPFAATVTESRYQFPLPGFHVACLMRPYSSTSALSSAIVTGNVQLNVLNAKQWALPFDDISRINYRSANAPAGIAAADLLAQSLLLVNRACIDFLSTTHEYGINNLDTALNTNPFTQLGTGPVFLLNVTGDSDNKIVFWHERFFGDISGALLLPKLLGASNK